jgi:nucleotide-binding universal stress UspA family protein
MVASVKGVDHMFTKILVCISNMEFPKKLTEYVQTQAKESQCTVVLVKIKSDITPQVAINPEQFPVHLSTGAVNVMEYEDYTLREHAEEITAKLSEQGINIEQTYNRGISIHDVAKFAKDNVVDLIVMAAQAHKGWKRFFLGSNVEEVLRGSNIPLLVFNPDKYETAGAI